MLRKLFILIAVALSSLASSLTTHAQTYTIDEIRGGVALINEQCPMDLDGGLTITSVVLNEQTKYMDMHFLLAPEAGITAEMMNMFKESIEPMMAQQVKSNDDMKELARMLKAHGYGFRMIFTDPAGGSAVFSIPASQL